MLTLNAVLPDKTAASTEKAIRDLLKKFPQKARTRKSMVFDNGKEFSHHDKLGIKTYCCDPYASWKKGGVENTNGRLRRDLQRYIDVKNMKKDDFDEAIENDNTTPPKNLE